MKRFAFGAAADLYKNKQYPRLLFGPSEWSKLRRQVAGGDGKIILDAVRPSAAAVMKEVNAAADVAQMLRGKDSRATHLRMQAHLTAFVGELDQSDEMIDAAKKVLLASAADGRVDPLGYDILQPHLTPAQRRLITQAMVKDIRVRLAEAVRYYYAGAAHNLTIDRTFGAFWSLLAIIGEPGVPAMKSEVRELLRRYEATLYTSVHPDGYPEEDIGYGTSVFGSVLLMGEAIRRAGLFDPYPAFAGVRNFGQSMLHFVQPWGDAVSNTGDHGSTFHLREFSLPRVAAETNDPTVLWLASTLQDSYRAFAPKNEETKPPSTVRIRGSFIVQVSPFALLALDDIKTPVHPAKAGTPTHYVDRHRGIVTFRNSWKKDATFIVFDGSHRSPAGPGHWHDSAGHFSLSALGEMFSIDTGRYNMEQSQHSVVIVDGKSGRSTNGEWTSSRYHGQLIDFVPDKLCDVAAADSSAQSDCYWSRRWIGLVKGGDSGYVWTVDDVNKNDGWHECWWQMQTSPENTISTWKDGAMITGWRYGNQLDVKLMVPPAAEFPKPHSVTYAQDINSTSSYKYVKDPKKEAEAYVHPARMAHGPCFVRPRLIAKVAGYNGRMMAVMTPSKKGGAKARVQQLTTVPASFAVRVDTGPFRDTIIFAFEHDLLEADGIVARGKWVVVRRLRKTGRVTAYTLGHGRSLTVDSRRLI